VFLDTTVMKLAADRVVRGFKRPKKLQWGSQAVTVDVVQFRYVPKVPRMGTAQFRDAALLPFIARLAKRGRLELLWHLEGAVEFWRLPDTDSPRGHFFGAPLSWVMPPLIRGRVIADGRQSMRAHQLEFLRSCKQERFLELQKAVGANEKSGHFENQFLDAYHIWCAEEAGARYFLTTDYRLCNHLATHRQTQAKTDVVTPRELLSDLRRRHEITFWDAVRARVSSMLLRFRTPPAGGLEALAELGGHLERQGYYDE
jgi:hypothetical protein